MVLCVVGGFSVNNSVYDVYIMLFFAALGYYMIRLKLPTTPLLLALILAPMAEENLRRALVVSKGSWWIFVQRPVSCAFLIITICAIIFPIALGIYRDRKARQQEKVK